MSEKNAKSLYAEANTLMDAIDEEVNRPEEDAIRHFICHNSRQCIQNYLSGFLLENGVSPATPTTLDMAPSFNTWIV